MTVPSGRKSLLASLVQECIGSRRRGIAKPSHKRPTRRALRMEFLEDRRVMATVPGFSAAELEIDPQHYASDHVLVRFQEGKTPPSGLRGEQLVPGTNIWSL